MRHRTFMTIPPTVCLLLICAMASAQAAPQAAQVPSDKLHFDSAYIESSKPNAQEEGGYMSEGQAVYVNATMLDIISDAYGLPNNRILGGPDWLSQDLYNFRGKAPVVSTKQQMQQMLQAFLVERFSLVTHTEKRPLSAYALTVSGGGPKFKPTTSSDRPSGCQGVPLPPGATPGRVARQVNCTNMSMGDLADQLPNMAPAYIDHPVVDSTELQGKYDFSLKWIGRGQLRNSGDPDYDPEVDISMFSSVEKLGLKLTPIQAPTPVLVVDLLNKTPLVDADHPMPPPPSMPTEFEVAVIKPVDNSTQQNFMYRVTPSGEVDICCFPLDFLISDAFDGIDTRRILSKPKWLNDDRWDVRAKTVPGATEFDVAVMMQNLLKSRFQFAYHEETQTIPVFLLHVGDHPKLTQNTKGGRTDCANSNSGGNRVLTCTNMTMAQLAENLWNYAGGYFDKPVVDATGLKGAYDFAITFATAGRTGYNNSGRNGTDGSAPLLAPSGALTIFEAIDKQLGLKFSTDKAPQKVIVIDHLERTPTGN